MGYGKRHRQLFWAMGVLALLVCASVGLLWGAQRSRVTGPKKAPAKAAPVKAAPARSAPVSPAAPAGVNGVEIISPKSDAQVRGVVMIQAAWAQSSGYLLFRVDDRFVYASAAPYKMRWDTSTMEDGPHVLSADAFDAKGSFQGSSSLRLQVKNTIDAPSGGVLLSVRFGPEDMLERSVSALGELAAPGAGEILPPGCENLTGALKESMSQTVMDPFYQGTSVLLRNRLKEGTTTNRSNVRTAVSEVGQYAMVQVSRNGLTLPQVTAVRSTRLGCGEISLALPDYPVLVDDTWQSPLAVVPVLNAKKAVYVQAQHTFEGLRWYSNRECAVIKSTYTLPRTGVLGSASSLASAPRFEVSLTQMGGANDEGMMIMRGRMRGGRVTRGAARAPGTGTPAPAQAQAQAGWLVDGQGTRTTYVVRSTGRVLHTEDKIWGRIEFRSTAAAAPRYTLDLTQMGGAGDFGMMRRPAGRGAARPGAAPGAPRAGAPTVRYPSSLDYAFQLSTELVNVK